MSPFGLLTWEQFFGIADRTSWAWNSLLGQATESSLTALLALATQAEMEAGSSATVLVTPGRQHFHPSAAKAWATGGFSGNVTASYNVSSLTDNGTGDQTYNLTVAFSSNVFTAVVSAFNTIASDYCAIGSISAGAVQVHSFRGDTGALADLTASFFAAFGDR